MDIFTNLGIDWQSVIVYVINFGALVAILAYFFTGPLLKMIDTRREKIKNNLEEAERIKNEFVVEKKKADAEKESLRIDMEQQMSDLKKDLENKRKEQDEQLALKKAKMLEEVRTLVADEKNGILKAAEKQTVELIEKVVLHVVSNNVPADVVKSSVAEAWNTYK
jgi:F-type H+-transporting ATPase subunit b